MKIILSILRVIHSDDLQFANAYVKKREKRAGGGRIPFNRLLSLNGVKPREILSLVRNLKIAQGTNFNGYHQIESQQQQ